MSQENVEIVRGAIRVFNEGEFDRLLAGFAPDVEVDLSRALGPIRGVYTLDQTRRVIDELAGTWRSFRIEPDEFIEADEHVVVPWTYHVVGRDGIEVQARSTWAFTIRSGAITRVCMYQERQYALESVGLRG
jgi:ketosteroid isomerase-like protein